MAERGYAAKVRKVRIVQVPVRVRNTVEIGAHRKKVTHLRSQLCDGGYMITYYFSRGQYGELIAEDIGSATHCERVVYDAQGNVLGSSIGEMSGQLMR